MVIFAIFWFILVAVLIIIELITLGLTTIWFAGGAFIAGIFAMFDAPIFLQILVFILVSVLLLVFTRPIAQKHINAKTEKTNLDSLIGEKGIVLVTINNLNSTGQIMLNGIEWSARSSSDDVIIDEGATVTVQQISGVKVIVSQ